MNLVQGVQDARRLVAPKDRQTQHDLINVLVSFLLRWAVFRVSIFGIDA